MSISVGKQSLFNGVLNYQDCPVVSSSITSLCHGHLTIPIALHSLCTLIINLVHDKTLNSP